MWSLRQALRLRLRATLSANGFWRRELREGSRNRSVRPERSPQGEVEGPPSSRPRAPPPALETTFTSPHLLSHSRFRPLAEADRVRRIGTHRHRVLTAS